jgi:hypothetical protein
MGTLLTLTHIVVLYKRLVLGEKRRKLPREGPATERQVIELQPPKAIREDKESSEAR